MKLNRKYNWQVTASAFALTALLVFGTAATHATTVGQTANNANATPPAASNAQTIASAPLPQDLTVTPNLKMDAYAGQLPGGASLVHAVFITTEKKKVDVPLLSASLTTKKSDGNNAGTNEANNEATVTSAPDIAVATVNVNAATAEAVNATVHSIALSPKTEVAMATHDATTDAANLAATNAANNAHDTATALAPTTATALASLDANHDAVTNAVTNTANLVNSSTLTATTGAGKANTRSELAGLNSNPITTAANINQSDHVASLSLSASLKSEDATNGNTGTTFANTASSSVIS